MKHKRNGVEIVLTASAVEMSSFNQNPFVAFMGGFSKGPIPLHFIRKTVYPPVKSDENGVAVFAPYGLRKIEAALIENGFDESSIVVVHPSNLNKFVGPKTKVIGISTMDPTGMGYVSQTYSSLLGGGEPLTSIEFRNLMNQECIRRYKPKIIVGGSGAWQLERKKLRKAFGIDCVLIGEGEHVAPELFRKAINGEELPPVVYGELLQHEEIPTIKHASIYGCVEISRGCGRGCQFCTPTMRRRRDFPLDHIMKEVEVNVREGSNMIVLGTEDIFLYGAKSGKFIPDKESVLNLVKKIASYPQIKAIQPAHMSLAPVVCDPSLVSELSEILIEHNCYGFRGKPIVTAETGIETGSTRLIEKYMKGKPLPFKPKEWRDVVCQAFGILNDNDWYPLATMIVGLPEETESDVLETLELIDDLRAYKSFLVPLLFVPLKGCALGGKRGINLRRLSDVQWQFITDCWRYNVDVWRESFLQCRFQSPLIHKTVTKFFIPLIVGSLYLFYYRWKHGRPIKPLITKLAELT